MESPPVRTIKPVVVPAQFYVFGPLIAGFISFFPGFFAFVVSQIGGVSFARGAGPDPTVGLVVFAISFAACLALLWVKCFKEPERTTYTISSDRVEYDEGLWNRHRRTVILDQVIDVELTEGVLQQTRDAEGVDKFVSKLRVYTISDQDDGGHWLRRFDRATGCQQNCLSDSRSFCRPSRARQHRR